MKTNPDSRIINPNKLEVTTAEMSAFKKENPKHQGHHLIPRQLFYSAERLKAQGKSPNTIAKYLDVQDFFKELGVTRAQEEGSRLNTNRVLIPLPDGSMSEHHEMSCSHHCGRHDEYTDTFVKAMHDLALNNEQVIISEVTAAGDEAFNTV